ncbi:signal peptidase II [Brachybacterium paraconglomeratum]|uniref:signal peptidase II n=1 Tax=Brachybacterium paraconglomeratum TaxID=173362 RepID=UPI0031EBAC66
MNAPASTPTSAGPTGSGARRRLSRGTVLGTIAVIAAVLAVIDQITKNWAVENLPLLDPQPFLGEVLQLTLLYNSGAAWGMGAEITPVVTCLQIAIVIGVIVFALKAVRSPWYTAALGLIMGGALGNIHDRLLRDPGPFHGAVVDFLELPNWPVFNVADMAVVGGAILIVALGLFGVDSDPAHADAADAAAEAAADDTAPEKP